MWRLIHRAFHVPSTPIYQRVEKLIWVCIVLSVVLLAIDLAGLLEDRDDLAFLHWLDTGFLVFFGIEVVLRIATYQPDELNVFRRPTLGAFRTHVLSRVRYALTPMILVDIFTVLAVVPALRGLRALRLLRLIRTKRMFKYANPFTAFARAVAENRYLFNFAYAVLGVEVLIGGITIVLIENGENEKLRTLGDGFWWALVTITTVGYGDITPNPGTAGRLLGAALMVGGMGTLALFAGIIGQSLMAAAAGVREEQFRMGKFVNHIVVCGYDANLRPLLDQITRDLDMEVTTVVVFHDSDRPRGIPEDFHWVRGDGTKESELEKVRLSHAAAVLIPAERTLGAQAADARTVLTAFTIRAYQEGRPETKLRRHKLYVVAEVLDAENVEHVRTAGADEVIETPRLGFSLLSHALTNPGVADSVSSMVLRGEQNFYVGSVPKEEEHHATFGALMRAMKLAGRGALVIGVHDPETGEQRINPPHDYPVSPTTELVYISADAVLPASHWAEHLHRAKKTT